MARKGIKPYTSFEKILIYIYLKKGITNQSHFLHKNTLDQDLINLLTLFIYLPLDIFINEFGFGIWGRSRRVSSTEALLLIQNNS